jgi:cytochrome c-type biogenesis protein CcmH
MAEEMAGVEPQVMPESRSAAVAPGQVMVSVDIKPELTRELAGNETLFILARAKNGSAMPLAVVRHTVSDLPLQVTLDDSMAMTPMAKLSGFDEVEVLARVSRSGQAVPQPGDLYGKAAGDVNPGNNVLTEIIIDQVQN